MNITVTQTGISSDHDHRTTDAWKGRKVIQTTQPTLSCTPSDHEKLSLAEMRHVPYNVKNYKSFTSLSRKFIIYSSSYV